MIVHHANKSRFREDILSNRIEFNIPQTGKRVDFIVTGTLGGCPRDTRRQGPTSGRSARQGSECRTMDGFPSFSSADPSSTRSQDRCGERSLPFLRQPLKKSRISNLCVGSGAFTATQRVFKKLLESGLVRRVGKGPSTSYQLIQP